MAQAEEHSLTLKVVMAIVTITGVPALMFLVPCHLGVLAGFIFGVVVRGIDHD